MPQPQKRGRAKKRGLTYALLGLLLLLAVGLTWRFGFPEHFSEVFAGGKKDTHPGKVAVLVSPVPLPAFSAIDPANFVNPQTGDFHVSWVTEQTAKDGGYIRVPGEINGRVLKRDKAAFKAFSEGDFFERGAQPSLTSALAPGQRAVTLNATDIEGLRSLKRFDRFDLYAVKVNPHADANGVNGYMSPEAAKAAAAGKEWETDRLVIAQGARVLVPVPTEKNPKNPDNVEVAMTIEEATALADARARGAKILCLASTGLPGGDATKIARPVEPERLDKIQVITNDKSENVYVPKKPENNE